MQLLGIFLKLCPIFLGILCTAERITYLTLDRPRLTYVNPKYVSYVNVTSRRIGRDDRFYYVSLHVTTRVSVANNVTSDVYFYEWLTNVYKPSFVEMHFRFCDLIEKDMFFGSTMKQGKLAQPCPYPPGEYHLYNMTVPIKSIPPHFPFRRGRVYVNTTATDYGDLIGSGHFDMEIKEFTIKKKKIN